MAKILTMHGDTFGAHDAALPSPGGFGARRRLPATIPSMPPRGSALPSGRGATYGTNVGTPLDAVAVTYRLEEAGTTLLALPNTGHSTRLRTTSFQVLAEALEGGELQTSAIDPTRLRPLPPDRARIDRMDEAWAWLGLIPRDRHVLRRIVGARSLVSPVTERHLFSWRRLGTALGADHKAVQRWHGQGIALIVAALRR